MSSKGLVVAASPATTPRHLELPSLVWIVKLGLRWDHIPLSLQLLRSVFTIGAPLWQRKPEAPTQSCHHTPPSSASVPSRRCSPPAPTSSRHYKYISRSPRFHPFFPFFFILTLKPKRELMNPCLEGRRPALHSAEPTGLDYPSGSSVSEFLLPPLFREPKPFSL